MKQVLIILFGCILFFSCSKTPEVDREAPVVTFSSPADNGLFPAGETVQVQGMVTDNQYIKMVHIEIRNFVTDAEYLHVHIVPTSKAYAFNQPFILEAGISYKIKVTAEDPAANILVQQVKITTN
jgi:hypothetical protein